MAAHAQDPAASGLAATAARFAAGQADGAELSAAFCAATVFAVAAERPGALAPAGGALPVFTSLAELGRCAGPVRWLSTTGEDLLRLLPPGADLLLDAAGETPLRLSGDAVGRTLVLGAGRRA